MISKNPLRPATEASQVGGCLNLKNAKAIAHKQSPPAGAKKSWLYQALSADTME
jgi:hypothetical protein